MAKTPPETPTTTKLNMSLRPRSAAKKTMTTTMVTTDESRKRPT
nr:hypothetical protein [Tanacetum cinerariifolium]